MFRNAISKELEKVGLGYQTPVTRKLSHMLSGSSTNKILFNINLQNILKYFHDSKLNYLVGKSNEQQCNVKQHRVSVQESQLAS